MSPIKPFTKLTAQSLKEISIRDCQTNKFEFTLMLSQSIDFDSFDILTVTRIDGDSGDSTQREQSHFLHPKIAAVDPAKVNPTSAEIIPIHRHKRK